MVADLAYDANGKACVFYSPLGGTPWHNEGHPLTGDEGYEDAITLVGLDYPLEKLPHFRPVKPGDANAGYQEAGDSFYIWRPDTRKVLGSVGSSYEIVTNRDAFEPLKPLIDEGVLRLETGGVLRDGADAWLMGKWDIDRFGPDVKEVFGEHLLPYATVMANHSGRRGVLLGNTTIRIVCSNTLGAAETDGSSRWAQIDHRTGAKVRLVEAAQAMFAGVVERYEIIAAQYRLMMNTVLSREEFRRLVLDVVAPRPDLQRNWNPEASRAESVLERNRQKRDRLTHLWMNGKGHTGEPTAWFGYNAAVECLDFDRDLFPTRAGCYRTASLLTGALAEAKNAVLDGLVAFAQGA